MKDEEKVVVEVKKDSRGEERSILSGIGTMCQMAITKRHVLPKTTRPSRHGINQNPLRWRWPATLRIFEAKMANERNARLEDHL